MTRVTRWRAGALAVAASLLLAACAEGTESELAPPAADEQGPQSGDTQAYENPFPACDEIWSPEEVREAAPHFEEDAIVNTSAEQVSMHAHGPAAQQAIREAERVQECMWGVEDSDNVVLSWQAELSDASLDELLSELDASDYERAEHDDGLVTYLLDGLELSAPGCVKCQSTSWYGFAGNLMIGQSPTDDQLPGLIVSTVTAMKSNSSSQ